MSSQYSGGRVRFLDLGGDRNIGEQHELLDKRVGLKRLLLLDINRFGRFSRSKVDFEFRT